jgi:hypothetical protein
MVSEIAFAPELLRHLHQPNWISGGTSGLIKDAPPSA